MMVVTVEQIEEAGLELHEPLPRALLSSALEQGRDTGFRPLGEGQLKASLRKVSGGVLLRGELTAQLVTPCKRCLSEVQLSLPVSFVLSLVPQREEDPSAMDSDDPELGSSGSFKLSEADEEPFDGKRIDLNPIVREQLLLALPMDAVCKEDCRGLCPMCGKDLNQGACGCETRKIDPRLAVLKDIKVVS